MKERVKKFLTFNGRTITFMNYNGEYFIAIRPIIEALGIGYTQQYKAVKRHAFFGRVLTVQTMHDAQNRLQKMVALPERYVYGWIFQIRSNNPELVNYQAECCDLLYNYFHGTITNRRQVLETRLNAIAEKRQLTEKLMADPRFVRIMEIKRYQMQANKELKQMDDQLLKLQLNLFGDDGE